MFSALNAAAPGQRAIPTFVSSLPAETVTSIGLKLDYRVPAGFAEMLFKFFKSTFGRRFFFHEREGSRAAAGHQRRQRAMVSQEILKQRQQRIFGENGRFQ